MMDYQALKQLQQHRAQLLDSTRLQEGIQLAAWKNEADRVSVCYDHHALSLYVADGEETYFKNGQSWQNGGGPDRFCLMPKDWQNEWDIRGRLKFVHLYYTDEHLRQTAEKIWDKSPDSIQLLEQVFGQDDQIAALYRFFLLNHSWHDPADRFTLSSATSLLLTHLIRHYSNVGWQTPEVRGSLATHALDRVQEWITAHLAESFTISDLAQVACLSEYHFSRLFKASTGQAPHQFVLQQRLAKAEQLVRYSRMPLTDIAVQCGFSSSAHLSTCFRRQFGYAPSELRKPFK